MQQTNQALQEQVYKRIYMQLNKSPTLQDVMQTDHPTRAGNDSDRSTIASVLENNYQAAKSYMQSFGFNIDHSTPYRPWTYLPGMSKERCTDLTTQFLDGLIRINIFQPELVDKTFKFEFFKSIAKASRSATPIARKEFLAAALRAVATYDFLFAMPIHT